MKHSNIDQLAFEFAQLCQRYVDGSIYGIADGKQCKKGKPISLSQAALFKAKKPQPKIKSGLKQVKVGKKDTAKIVLAKAKSAGLTNKEIKTISTQVKQKLQKKQLKGQEVLKEFAKAVNAKVKAKKGLVKPTKKPKIKPGLKQVKVGKNDNSKLVVAKAQAIGLTPKEISGIVEELKVKYPKSELGSKAALKDFAKAANKKAKEKKALAPLKQSIRRAKDSGASDKEVKDTLNKIKKEEGNITTPVAREKFEKEIEKKVNSVESDLDFPSDNDLGELEFVKDLGGSTGAKLVRDKKTGKQYVQKIGKNTSDEHLRNEFAADEAYRELGVNVPNAKLYNTPDGTVKLSEYIEGGRSLNQLSGKEREDAINEIKKDFAADALMGNWDVVGMSGDNVLIDKDGKVWRIDNGGALEFRAQGKKKEGDQWNEYPTELWSMKSSSQGKDVFGDLDHDQIMDQIRGLKKTDIDNMIGKLPQSVQPIMRRRVEEAQRVATISQTLKDDDFKEEYRDSFTRESLGLRNSGLVDKLSKKFEQDRNLATVLIDENGDKFDKLRGKDSLVNEWSNYVKSIGGDPDIISEYSSAQAGSSWAPEAKAMKYWFTGKQNVPRDNFLWFGGQDRAKEDYDLFESRYPEAVIDKTFSAFHAWTYEQLQRYEMPNNNRARGTIGVIRTIKEKYLKGAKVGNSGINLFQGALESYSMFSTYYFQGNEVVVQEVPHHRAIGMYLQNRPNGSPHTGLFAGNNENEIVIMQRGIPATYLGSQNNFPEGTKITVSDYIK